MKIQITKRNIGNFIIESNLKKGDGFKIVLEFLEKLFIEFSKQATKYMNSISNDTPFAYKERQLHSLLAPAISNLTDIFLMEQPIYRVWDKRKNRDGIDYSGWLDYWCRFNNYDFFIEVKHGYAAYRNDIIRKCNKKNWVSSITQLDNAKKEAKNYKTQSKGVFLVALNFVTIFYGTKKEESDPQFDLNILSEIKNNYNEELSPQPNWSALWMLHEELYKNSFLELRKNNEYYPGIIALANIKLI